MGRSGVQHIAISDGPHHRSFQDFKACLLIALPQWRHIHHPQKFHCTACWTWSGKNLSATLTTHLSSTGAAGQRVTRHTVVQVLSLIDVNSVSGVCYLRAKHVEKTQELLDAEASVTAKRAHLIRLHFRLTYSCNYQLCHRSQGNGCYRE